MMKFAISVILLASVCTANPAVAQQFQASADIIGGNGSSYFGRNTGSGDGRGYISDGGRDAFDGFGYYSSGLGGLVLNRQVELLSGNTYRFFDTFTNNTASSISQTLSFYGNLGSDGAERVLYNSGGLIVSCQFSGACYGDPVLALVSGNNGVGRASVSSGSYFASFSVTVDAGQSIGLLQYAFLASAASGTTSADVSLATSTGQQLLSAPRLQGLTSTQLAQVVNYDLSAVAPVPEPTTWAMMLIGFGMIGATARYRRRTRATVYA